MTKATAGKPCSIEGCEMVHYARGWCNKHWNRWRTHGDPLKKLSRKVAPEKKAETRRKYRETHREEIAEYNRSYKEANKEKILEQVRLYREKNSERRAEKYRRWYEENKERRLEYNHLYHETNREQLNEKSRHYIADNYERVREYQRTYRKANPEVGRAQHHRRRARLNDVRHEPWTTTGILERDGWICQIADCRSLNGRVIDPTLHHNNKWAGTIDHIVAISRGGHDVPANLQAAHRSCNSAKGARRV